MSNQESVIVPEKRLIVVNKHDSWSCDILEFIEPEQEAEAVVDLEAKCWNRILMAALYLFFVSVLTWSLGLIIFLRSDDGDVTRYYPGITVSCGAFLGVVGVQVIISRCPDSSAGWPDKARGKEQVI